MSRKLLLVEDEPLQEQLLLQFCRKDIQAGKYEIIYAPTGEDALQLIEADREHEIELIIADLKMPAAQIDGWKLIKLLNRRHIDIKTIIVTAVGTEEDFTEEERKNIFFFLDKMTSLETLKFLMELALDIPDKFDINSQKVGFNTLLKASKDLPGKQKVKLIKDLLAFLSFKDLKKLEKTILPEIQGLFNDALQRDELKQWLLEKQKNGQIDSQIPLQEVGYFFLDARTIGGNGPYYYLRWWQNGKQKYSYLPKKLVDEDMPLHLRPKPREINSN